MYVTKNLVLLDLGMKSNFFFFFAFADVCTFLKFFLKVWEILKHACIPYIPND